MDTLSVFHNLIIALLCSQQTSARPNECILSYHISSHLILSHTFLLYFILHLVQVWQGRSTTHPKFDPTWVRTHDLQIMTVHFMSLRSETPALTTWPSATIRAEVLRTSSSPSVILPYTVFVLYYVISFHLIMYLSYFRLEGMECWWRSMAMVWAHPRCAARSWVETWARSTLKTQAGGTATLMIARGEWLR